MSEERRKILEMLADKKISVEDAESLLAAIGEDDAGAGSPRPGDLPKYLRVVVEGSGGRSGDKVNIRVPLRLLRAGMKLANLIPEAAHKTVSAKLKERGIKFDLFGVGPEFADELLEHLCNMSVNVSGRHENVRVFCE